MSYITISHWRTEEWSDALAQTAREKYIPLVMQLGATGIDQIRTGELTYCVIVKYPDEATAKSAAEAILKIRDRATEDLPTEMTDLFQGPVFASN